MDSAPFQSPEPPPGPPQIGALLRRPFEALRHRLLDELHAAGFTDLVEAHLLVLRYPGPDGRRPSDLAASTGMTRQAVNYLLGQLEKAGYLTRSGDSDGDDKRSRRIDLTARGHAAFQSIKDVTSGFETELTRELGPAQMDQLRNLLIKLNTTQAVRRAPSRPLPSLLRPPRIHRRDHHDLGLRLGRGGLVDREPLGRALSEVRVLRHAQRQRGLEKPLGRVVVFEQVEATAPAAVGVGEPDLGQQAGQGGKGRREFGTELRVLLGGHVDEVEGHYDGVHFCLPVRRIVRRP